MSESADSSRQADRSARDRLLHAVVAHVMQSGLGQQSLRQLATSVGSSHRMLIYHFGSREGLLAAVTAELVARQLDMVADFGQAPPSDLPLAEELLGLWERMLGDVRTGGRAMIELWVRGMTSEPDSPTRRQITAVSVLEPLAAFWRARGYSRSLSTDLAVLHRAAGRGITVNLLLDGDEIVLHRCLTLFSAAFSLAADDAERLERHYLELVPPPRQDPPTQDFAQDQALAADGREPGGLDPRHDSETGSDGDAQAGSVSGSAGGAQGGVEGEPGSGSRARAELLDLVLDRLRGGIGDRSLRQLADELGTSHRMLLYHFGSRDGLLTALVERIEQDQAAELVRSFQVDSTHDPNSRLLAGVWDRVLDRFDRSGPLVFELALRAVHGEVAVERARELFVDDYLPGIADWWNRGGFTPTFAADVARLHVLVSRGVVLDYLLDEDERRGRRALALFDAMFGSAARGAISNEQSIEAVMPPRPGSRRVGHDARLIGGT